jgi:RNA polymerase sigma-54 factor
MAIGAGIAQKQTFGMVPEHILGKSVLKMGLQELQEYVQTQLTENPALVLQEDRVCPICGSVLLTGVCDACGSTLLSEDDLSKDGSEDDWQEDSWTTGEAGDDYYEPFASVAAPSSLDDHLRGQIRTRLPEEDIPVAELIVDCLEEDGYLREPLYDIASRIGMSVPQLEAVLEEVQKFDPPGIAARSLQECLLIQVRQIDDDSEDRRNSEGIILECWDSMTRMKLDEVARRLQITREDVVSALRFIKERLNPHPASMFRDPWQTMAPRRDAKLAPDVVVRQSELGLTMDVVGSLAGRVTIDELYSTLYAEMSRKKNGFTESDRERVRESVQGARALIEALEFRKTALRTVADKLLEYQSDFFKHGPSHLKPLTKKELAQMVGLHESTICRATDSKRVQLHTGEVIPIDVLFDSALPIKELVRKLSQERLNGRPLSDGQIAERLQSQGIQIARRTVAKYRDELRVLPVEYRLG